MRVQQPLPAAVAGTVQRAGGLVAQRRAGAQAGPAKARYLTMRSFCPGRSPQITVVRARSGRASVVISTRPGTSTSCSIPAAIISALARVRCMRSAPRSVRSCSTACSGLSRMADTRGSAEVSGTSSLVTSSDCTVTRTNSSIASTTYSIAATLRWASDTSRVDVTLTCLPAGERQCTRRVSVPARRSRIRSWEINSPYRTSNGSSPTNRRKILPLVTSTTVWPASGYP